MRAATGAGSLALPKPGACAVNMDSVHVVALRALTERVGALAPERHGEVKRALGQALDWPELTGA